MWRIEQRNHSPKRLERTTKFPLRNSHVGDVDPAFGHGGKLLFQGGGTHGNSIAIVGGLPKMSESERMFCGDASPPSVIPDKTASRRACGHAHTGPRPEWCRGATEWTAGNRRRPSHRGRVVALRDGRAVGACGAGTASRAVGNGRDRQGAATSVTSHRVPVCRKPACRG